MKILLLAPFPYGTSSGQGGATVCFNALRALAKSHDVSVLCFSNGSPEDKKAVLEMGAHAALVRSVPLVIKKWHVVAAKLRGLFGATPEHAVYFESDAFRTALGETLRDLNPQLVITQFPQMAQYLACCSGFPTVHDIQDAFSVSWFRRFQTAPKGLRRWYAAKQWANWVQYELRYYPMASQCWALSDQDKYGLTAFNPRLNVINMGLPLIDKVHRAKGAASGQVGFIGSFGHPPNREALRFLIEEIAPRVLRRMPEVQFVIAGREPPAALVRSAPSNTRFVGYVESLEAFYASCRLIVAPLLSGGGVKIKVAEALSFGKAVVTTPIGAEGVGIESGTHAVVESDAEMFAEAVCELLASESRIDLLEASAFELARGSFSSDAWCERVNRQIRALPSHYA